MTLFRQTLLGARADLLQLVVGRLEVRTDSGVEPLALLGREPSVLSRFHHIKGGLNFLKPATCPRPIPL